jgi:hypothetical protein
VLQEKDPGTFVSGSVFLFSVGSDARDIVDELARKMDSCNDFADEGLEFGLGMGDL